MKLSYNQGCTLWNSTLAQDLVLCEQAGYDYIELRIDKLREYLLTHTLDELKAFFAGHRIKPHSINGVYVYADFLGENDTDTERSRALMEDITFACRVAQAVGSPAIVVVPDMNRDEAENKAYDKPWKDIFRETVRIFTQLSDIAGPYGINIALELVGSKRCSVRTVEQAAKIINAVNRSNVGYTIDAFNLYLYNRFNDFSILKQLDPKKIFVVHINNSEDVPLESLRQAHRTFADCGPIDIRGYLSNLKEMGYDGMVSIEFFRPDCWEKPAEWVIQETYRTTREVLEKYGVLN